METQKRTAKVLKLMNEMRNVEMFSQTLTFISREFSSVQAALKRQNLEPNNKTSQSRLTM